MTILLLVFAYEKYPEPAVSLEDTESNEKTGLLKEGRDLSALTFEDILEDNQDLVKKDFGVGNSNGKIERGRFAKMLYELVELIILFYFFICNIP